jgi:hypothetical protein
MDKVIEKKEQHAKLCKVLAAEGYDVMLLPIVLGSAGTLFKCLHRATQEMDISNARKIETLQQAPATQYTRSTKPCVSAAIPGKTKANRRSKGNNKRQVVFLPIPICP